MASRRPQRELKRLLFELFIFAVVVGTVSLFWENNTLTFFVLLGVWLTALLFWHTSKDVIAFIVGAIAGPVAEIVSVSFGAWSYTNPTLVGIPLWLPLVWGFASVLLTRLTETAHRMSRERGHKKASRNQ